MTTRNLIDRDILGNVTSKRGETDEERSKLIGLPKKGTIAARKLARAQILRLADAGKQDAAPASGHRSRASGTQRPSGASQLAIYHCCS
jgi:hypothetical protein